MISEDKAVVELDPEDTVELEVVDLRSSSLRLST